MKRRISIGWRARASASPTCYTPMPYGAPTRASLLTGRYPFRHGM
jgi:hypothetical protein